MKEFIGFIGEAKFIGQDDTSPPASGFWRDGVWGGPQADQIFQFDAWGVPQDEAA